jgi:hypothetical protein
MADRFGQVVVRIFTAPEASCGTGMTWVAAVGFVRERLSRRFDGRVAVEQVEIFSQRSFEFPTVLEAIRQGAELPIVLVGGRIVSQGGKLSESRIALAIEALGVRAELEPRREECPHQSGPF